MMFLKNHFDPMIPAVSPITFIYEGKNWK